MSRQYKKVMTVPEKDTEVSLDVNKVQYTSESNGCPTGVCVEALFSFTNKMQANEEVAPPSPGGLPSSYSFRECSTSR